VGFAAGHRAALEALTGDAGARMLVRDAGDALVTLDVDDPGVLADIDTREDLERSAER
jgi:molybdenum cofactor cytidylyltransferase